MNYKLLIFFSAVAFSAGEPCLPKVLELMKNTELSTAVRDFGRLHKRKAEEAHEVQEMVEDAKENARNKIGASLGRPDLTADEISEMAEVLERTHSLVKPSPSSPVITVKAETKEEILLDKPAPFFGSSENRHHPDGFKKEFSTNVSLAGAGSFEVGVPVSGAVSWDNQDRVAFMDNANKVHVLKYDRLGVGFQELASFQLPATDGSDFHDNSGVSFSGDFLGVQHHSGLYLLEIKPGQKELVLKEKKSFRSYSPDFPSWSPEGLLIGTPIDGQIEFPVIQPIPSGFKSYDVVLTGQAKTQRGAPVWNDKKEFAISSLFGVVQIGKVNAAGNGLEILASKDTKLRFAGNKPSFGPRGLLTNVGGEPNEPNKTSYFQIHFFERKNREIHSVEHTNLKGHYGSHQLQWNQNVGVIRRQERVLDSKSNGLAFIDFDPETRKVTKVQYLDIPYLASEPAWGPGGLLAAATYRGDVLILGRKGPDFEIVEKYNLVSNIEAPPTWGPDGLLIVPGKNGKINILRLKDNNASK